MGAWVQRGRWACCCCSVFDPQLWTVNYLIFMCTDSIYHMCMSQVQELAATCTYLVQECNVVVVQVFTEQTSGTVLQHPLHTRFLSDLIQCYKHC